MIAALVFLGALDGLLFLPVLLSLVGPPGELVSTENPDHLPSPTPPVTPPPPYRPSSSIGGRRSKTSPSHHHHSQHESSSTSSLKRHHHYSSHHGSNLSLTTITEEPTSNNSSTSSSSNSSASTSNSSSSASGTSRHSPFHEILVKPQVVVETTTYNGKPVPGGDINKDPGSMMLYDGGHHVTTTVTATAKVKVEVHKPIPGNVKVITEKCFSLYSCRYVSNIIFFFSVCRSG